VVFVISAVFPIAAGLAKNKESFPKWWSPTDVTLAAVLGLLAIAVQALGRGHIDSHVRELTYRAYRVLIHSVFALGVVFILAGDRIVWANCLTGFAWRAWLLLYILPEWLALVVGSPRSAGSPRESRA